MNRKRASILILLCVIGLLPIAGTGASNQNLEWGVQIGDRFDFHFRYENYYEPIYNEEYDCYIVVESLPAIPNDINEVNSPWRNSPWFFLNETTDLGLYFANSTEIGLWATLLPQMILPIGNWGLWSDLLEDYEASSTYYSESINITETPIEWTWTYSFQSSSDELAGQEGIATFRKSDGVLTYYQHAGFNNMRTKYFEYEITPVGIIPQMAVQLALAGLIVGIIALVIIYKKR